MRDNRGFTLLEILIIIIIFAFIIALLFSYFGNPLANISVHSSAEQIVDSFRTIDDAWNSYYIETLKEADNLDTLFQKGYLKFIPVPPQTAKMEGFTDKYAYSINRTDYDFAGSSTPDVVVTLRGISEPVCRKINHLYGGFPENSEIPVYIHKDRVIQCIRDGDSTLVLKTVYIK